MAASHVQVGPDSTGKNVDSASLTSSEAGNPTVQRQTITIGDPTTYGNIAAVTGAGALAVQGLQPAATTFSGITATGAQASTAATNYNIATVTLRTFTGTTPSITFKLQASDDNTNWVDLQGTNNSTGQVGVTWTQASALTAGTAGPSIDYTIGAYTNVRINVTAISGTSATAAFGLGLQSMPYDPTPGIQAMTNSTIGFPAYSASKAGGVGVASATDVALIGGSATKTIYVTRFIFDSTITTTAALATVALIKRSTADTAGTSTTTTRVPNDSNSPAATAACLFYTANPTLGTAIANVRTWRYLFLVSAGTANPAVIDHTFVNPIALRGTAEQLCVNLSGQGAVTTSIDVTFEWFEV